MVVKLQGGLGNQLFEYAFGRSLSLARKEELFFDPSMLQTGNPKRRYGLGDYNISVRFAKPDTPGEVFTGYWQAERFFDGALMRRELSLPRGRPNSRCMGIAGRIVSTPQTCFIGVRRSDYLWPERIAFHGVLPMDYYHEAIAALPADSKFFIFSDDPQWCRENFCYDVVDVNAENEKHWDIWLMSLCKHAIIANSSFHWWSAWLGPDRVGKVIAPKKWFVQEKSEIVPPRWMTL